MLKTTYFPDFKNYIICSFLLHKKNVCPDEPPTTAMRQLEVNVTTAMRHPIPHALRELPDVALATIISNVATLF